MNDRRLLDSRKAAISKMPKIEESIRGSLGNSSALVKMCSSI